LWSEQRSRRPVSSWAKAVSARTAARPTTAARRAAGDAGGAARCAPTALTASSALLAPPNQEKSTFHVYLQHL